MEEWKREREWWRKSRWESRRERESEKERERSSARRLREKREETPRSKVVRRSLNDSLAFFCARIEFSFLLSLRLDSRGDDSFSCCSFVILSGTFLLSNACFYIYIRSWARARDFDARVRICITARRERERERERERINAWKIWHSSFLWNLSKLQLLELCQHVCCETRRA